MFSTSLIACRTVFASLALVLFWVCVPPSTVLAQRAVTHTGDSGSGSLREAIAESNRHPGPDDIVFDIPSTDPGFNGTWWTIILESPLPALVDDGTRILGFTQAHNQDDSNPGYVGSGGSVGVVRRELPVYRKPEIAIDASGFDGLTLEGFAIDILIEGVAVYGAANGIVGLGLSAASKGPTSTTNVAGTNRVIREVLVGVLPTGLDPGSQANTGHGIVLQTSMDGLEAVELDVEKCFVGYNGQVGIVGERSATTMRISLSEVFANGWATDAHDGIDVNGVNGVVEFNLSRDNRNASGIPVAGSGAGIEAGSSEPSTGDNLIENNTVRANLGAGIAIRGGSSGNLVRSNIVFGNEVGISVNQAGSSFTDRNILSENSIFGNHGIGIDLHAGDSSAPFDGVTENSTTSGLAGANLLQPYPIIESAVLVDDTLRIAGFASEGATIEVFEADRDETGFGEGRRHLLTVTESSATDLDPVEGKYGVDSLTAHRFLFVLPLRRMTNDRATATDRALLLTATERVSANTSEFGPTIPVARLPGRVRPISPRPRETDVAIPTTFTWGRATAADTYELQVFTPRDSSQLVVDKHGLVRTGYRADVLSENTSYLWRVRARNASGVGRWSDPSIFTTGHRDTRVDLRHPPGMVYPKPEQTNVELAVKFKWTEVRPADRVTGYRLQLSKVAPDSDNRFKDTTFVHVEDTTLDWILSPGQPYYWHVAVEYPDTVIWSDSIRTFTTGPDCAPRSTIALLGPPDGARRLTVNPTFNWQSRNDPAVSYLLEITDREPLTNGGFVGQTSIPVAEPPFAGTTLAENTTYYWRVRGDVCGNAGVWSKHWSFDTNQIGPPPVGPVTLLTPDKDAKGVSTTTPFKWLTAADADSYRIEISQDSGFASIADGAPNLFATEFEPNRPLEFGRTYFWRVRGRNALNVGPWSESWSFTTTPEDTAGRRSHYKPGLTYPLPEEIEVDTDVIFGWTRPDSADGLIGYRFKLSIVPPVSHNRFEDTTFVRVQGTIKDTTLALDQQYYWFVAAEYPDSVVWADSIWTFTTGSDCPPPVTIALLNPPDRASGLPVNPAFNWQSSSNPEVSYLFEITDRKPLEGGDFVGQASIQVAAPPFADTTLAENTTYYWRVRGDVCGHAGVWSKHWSFDTNTTDLRPIGPVTSLTPGPGASSVSTKTPFTWLTATNAEFYRVEISRDSGFASIFDGASNLIATQFERTDPLENGQIYYWRVRGQNLDAVGAWTVASFKTISYRGEFLEPVGKTRLAQNRPNPFNPSTTIDFEVKGSSHVELSVYDIQGRLIRTLESGYKEAGVHHTVWDGRDSSGRPAPSGVYVYRIVSGEATEARRMLLLK